MSCGICGAGEFEVCTDACQERRGLKPKAPDKPIEGRKDDAGKARWDLLPWKQVKYVVQVLTLGAKKYADNNWQKVENPRPRYFAAAMRHLNSWFEGEILNEETGLPNLAEAICNLLFLMWFDDANKVREAVKKNHR